MAKKNIFALVILIITAVKVSGSFKLDAAKNVSRPVASSVVATAMQQQSASHSVTSAVPTSLLEVAAIQKFRGGKPRTAMTSKERKNYGLCPEKLRDLRIRNARDAKNKVNGQI